MVRVKLLIGTVRCIKDSLRFNLEVSINFDNKFGNEGKLMKMCTPPNS